MSKKHKDSKNLNYPVKVSLDEALYKKLGEESQKRGVSMAAILREAYIIRR